MKKFASLFSVLSLVSVLVVPVSSFASPGQPVQGDIVASLQAQIASLLAQVRQLQAQLGQVQSQPAQFCYNWTRNLRVGDTGADVVALWTALKNESIAIRQNTETESSYFGEPTASAVVGFQEKYRSEILTPNGLAHGTGYVGPATRKKLNSLYGCGNVVRTGAPVISGLDAPTTLAVGETGTWTVKAYDPENGSLSYSVVWGDEVNATQGFSSTPAPAITQSATFTHVYNQAGTFTPTFLVRDNTGLDAKTSATVQVGSIPTASFVNLLTTVNYSNGNQNAFIGASIKGVSNNKDVSYWVLDISCREVTMVDSAGKERCGSRQTYYAYSYYDVTQDISLVTANAKTTAPSPDTYPSVHLVLTAYNGNGNVCKNKK